MFAPALAVLLVTAMTAAAELSGEREILFPEIAAVAAGTLAAPKHPWNTDPLRLFLSLAAGSVIGTATVLLIPLPLAVQLCIAFLISSLMLAFSRTTFAPMISSVVLPVMLGTRSAVYPVSAVLLTAAVIGCRLLTETHGLRSPEPFTPEPKPDRRALTDLLLRWGLGCLVILFAVKSGQRLIAAPPLLVAYTEFWRPGAAAQRKPLPFCLMLTGCAALGALLRYPALHFGIRQFPAAGVTVLLVLLLMRRTGLWLPPAAALSLLSFLVPEQTLLLYPVQVFAGTLFFMGLAMLHGRIDALNQMHPADK